jgi:hypothetical protein
VAGGRAYEPDRERHHGGGILYPDTDPSGCSWFEAKMRKLRTAARAEAMALLQRYGKA